VTDDARAVLEGIAFGDDPMIRPGERLRALELLSAAEADRHCFCDEVARLDGAALHELEDALLAGLFLARDDDERRRVWPQTTAALDSARGECEVTLSS
jgi:hypothetical protein